MKFIKHISKISQQYSGKFTLYHNSLRMLSNSETSDITSTSKKFKVLVGNDTVPSIALNLLKTECDVLVCEEDEQIIKRNIVGVHALFWASYDIKVDGELLDRAGPQLKAIATMSAGYDQVDLEALKRRGIKFGNTPGVVGSAVAEQAIMLALASARRLNEANLAIQNSDWPTKYLSNWLLGVEISGSTIGIIGLGSIGQAIAKKLRGFEAAKYLYTGRKEKPEGRELGCEFVSFDTLIRNSDFIFSCIPLTKETTNLFNYEVFSKMKSTAVFINVGRGGSVNQSDLVRALREKLIFAAGLDVVTPEPLPPDDELLKLPNCIVAPHLGTSTRKTSDAMAELTAMNILKALRGESMLTPVT